MGVFLSLSGIALREVARGALQTVLPGGGADAVIDYLSNRFTNHSQRLTNALQSANERAWKAFEVALGGESLWDKCKLALASAEDKAFREQLRAFLEQSPLKKVKAESRPTLRKALEELRAARSKGALAGGNLAPSLLAKEAGSFAAFKNPQDLIDAERKALKRVAEELQETCPNLYLVLVAPKLNPPILAVAVRYFFRREVETDQQLFQGLAFAAWEKLQESQEKGFAALTDVLSRQGQRLAELIAGLDERIERIENQIQKLLDSLQLRDREVRPSDSLSIRSDAERALVRQLIERYRSLSEGEKAELPGLLNNLGKLQVASGDFGAAQGAFADAAARLEEPKRRAEAHHNAYRAALEQQAWAEALAALREAVALDPVRFAPYPATLYEPQRILGAGGFGVVFLCRHQLSGKLLVVKSLLASELDRDPKAVFAEAAVLEDLEHPAIIRLRECNYADTGQTRPYLVMDYFDGVNLADYVVSHGPLPPDDVLAIARQAAEALQAAHAKGILHRDVKPGNLLVRRAGTGWKVKLIDFGLALRPGALEEKVSTQAPQARTTMGRSIAGTLHYAAPEQMGQAPGVAVGAYSDIYGFGKTCYYALLKDPEPDEEEKEALPESWRSLLRKCTRKDAAKRLPDFAAVLAELAAMDNPQPQPPQFDQDMKEALEEIRMRGDSQGYFERQGPTRIADWRAAADKGVAAAQWLLASCLFEGAGIQEDAEAALTWLRRAAEGGLPVALTDLGDCYYPDGVSYYSGESVKQDGNESVRLYTAAAAQGFPEAQADLGDCYGDGVGVAEDLAEAARHYRKAAEAGWARGQDSLGECYWDGSGVEQDYWQAVSWYRKAAELGLASAQFNLAYCYDTGKGIKKDRGEAAKWYRKAAEQGNDESQFAIGYCYEYGEGVERDRAQAKQWYQKAADQGHRKAKNALRRLNKEEAGGPAAPEDEDMAEAADERGIWAIAPYSADEPDEWQKVWAYDLANGVISIGWEGLGDISALDEQSLRAAIDRRWPDPDTSAGARGQYFRMLWDFFHSIKVGDIILARQGTKKLAAIGTVTRAAYYDPNMGRSAVGDWYTFAYHLGVRWEPSPRDKQFPDIVFGMQTLHRILEEKYRTLVREPPAATAPQGG